MISKQKKPVEKPKKPVEKPKKSVEKPKKPVEKPKKSVEKPNKSVEKPKKPVEKPKKPVEKPNKSVLKKRVKNVNVDKIVKIIKKCIIKCGFKNPKLKGGENKVTMFLKKGVANIGKLAQSVTNKFGKKNSEKNECFENLKAIDKVFTDIKDEVIAARQKLLVYLKSSNADKKVLFDKLLLKYKFIKTDEEEIYYNYKYDNSIKIKFPEDYVEKITNEYYLIIYMIDIVEQLERYREGMLLCVQNDFKDDEEKSKILDSYNSTIDEKNLFKCKKDDDEGDDKDDGASATMPQRTADPDDDVGEVYFDMDEDEEATSISRLSRERTLGSPPPPSSRSRSASPYARTFTPLPRKAEL